MRKSAAVLAGLLLSAAMPAHAADREWSLEITPYMWFAGIDGDVTVGDRTVNVDLPFEDLIDAVEVGGMLLGTFQYRHWVALAQLDYVATDTSNLDNPPARGRVESTFFMSSLGAGYQIGVSGRSTIDVLLGARILYLDNELTLNGIGTFEKSNTIADPVLFVRPSFVIWRWLRFNPIVSIGGLADSDLTYELQPTLQFQILRNLAARVGYRRVYYDFEGPMADFKGAMSGFFVGLGLTI